MEELGLILVVLCCLFAFRVGIELSSWMHDANLVTYITQN